MATDMFGNILSPEERERLRLHQLRMGIEPAPMVTPSLYPNQAAPYGSFPMTTPTTPSIWESPLGVVPSAPQLAGPTVNKFKPLGSDYTPQQLSTPIKDLQQQNIPSNVLPITPFQKVASTGTGTTSSDPSSDKLWYEALRTKPELWSRFGEQIPDVPTGPRVDPNIVIGPGSDPFAQNYDMSRWDMLPDPSEVGTYSVMPNMEVDQPLATGLIPASDLRIGRGLRDFYAPTDDVTTDVTPQVPMYSDDTWDATNPFNRGFIDRMIADSDAAKEVDTFVDMPQETQASLLDMTKTSAGAILRQLGLVEGPMSTGMSEEGLEKVLETAWENQKSNPNNPVALSTLQAGQLGLSKQDESAYDANIGAIPAGVVSLSPAGYTYNDPAGIQLVSDAAAADPTVTPTETISKKFDFLPDFLRDVLINPTTVDIAGKALGVHPVTDFAPSTGGGGTDALYYQGYTAPDVAKPTPAGPSAADIERQKQAAINARMAQQAIARQQQQAQAAQAAQAAVAQQAAAQQALQDFYSSRAYQEEGAETPAGLIDVASQVDTFAGYGGEGGAAGAMGGYRGDPVGREAAIGGRR